MELLAPASLTPFLPVFTHSCRVSVVLLSSTPFSSFGVRASAEKFTLFASCLLPRLVRCRSAFAAMFTDAAAESDFGHFRICPDIDSSHKNKNTVVCNTTTYLDLKGRKYKPCSNLTYNDSFFKGQCIVTFME